jgi:hypothetical protein
LEATIDAWLSMGVGPWYVLPGITQNAEYHSTPCQVTATLALANSGDLQVELIRQDDDTTKRVHRVSATKGPGLHQLASGVHDYDAALTAARDADGPWSGWANGETGVRYSYLVAPAGTAAVVELMELNELSQGLATLVRDAAVNWDGSEPVRQTGLITYLVLDYGVIHAIFVTNYQLID